MMIAPKLEERQGLQEISLTKTECLYIATKFNDEDVMRCFGLANDAAARVRINRLMKDRLVVKSDSYVENGTTKAHWPAAILLEKNTKTQKHVKRVQKVQKSEKHDYAGRRIKLNHHFDKNVKTPEVSQLVAFLNERQRCKYTKIYRIYYHS